MPLRLHFPEYGWDSITQDWSAWWAGELGRALVVLECFEPQDETTPHYASTFLGNYRLEIAAEELLNLFIPRLEATYYLGDAFPRFWPNFGPGVVAAFAGAHLHPVEDTTWFSPGDNEEISRYHVGLLPDNPWWLRVKEVTQEAVNQWGDQLSVGFTDLGGNLDILAHLRGAQKLLLDLYDAPEEVDRLVCETTRLWLKCYDELYHVTRRGRGCTCWGPCWSSTRGYLLQSDFSYMISPKMFERYVLPDLSACCEALDYAFYHLDGKGQLVHMDMLLAMERLRGMQWVPGDGQPQAEHWLTILSRIRQSGKLCQVNVNTQGALTILRELGGKGFALLINEKLSPEQGNAFLNEIRWTENLHLG
jgi:hypothetical protein